MKANNHYLIIMLLAGAFLGSSATYYLVQKNLVEIEITEKSIEHINALLSYNYYKMLADGKVEEVKKGLYEDYEKTKKKANAIDIEELSNRNWPFTVDDWYIEQLRKNINFLNEPDPCKK